MDSSKIKLILIGLGALFAAIYLGIAAATAQFEAISWVVGSLVLIACVLLGKRIWLLIPLMAAVNISIRIPTMPNTLMLAQVLVLGFSALMFCVRKVELKPQIRELEWWMIGLFLLILQVYVRNPAGVWVFGTATVGGKAYFVFLLTLASALYLAFLVVDPKDLRRVVMLSIVGGMINLAVGLLGRVYPVIGYYTGMAFRIDEGYAGPARDEGAATRLVEFTTFGKNLGLWICSFRDPLRAVLNPVWLFLMLVSVVCVMVGGFRSGVAALALTYLVGIWYRGGWGHLVTASLIGAAGLSVLAAVNAVAPLPPNIQRSLTFLPGTWEERYKQDAEGSTDWRVEVWKEVLFTDRWISNKVFGDGLGFTAEELRYQTSIETGDFTRMGVTGWDLQREGVLASGDYHSGPVSTVRVIGYFGLGFLVLFQIRLAILAHRQIVRCRGTEWYPLALLIGIPLVWGPLYFHLIFGDFRKEAIVLLMGAAMIRVLERGLPLPAYRPGRRIGNGGGSGEVVPQS